MNTTIVKKYKIYKILFPLCTSLFVSRKLTVLAEWNERLRRAIRGKHTGRYTGRAVLRMPRRTRYRGKNRAESHVRGESDEVSGTRYYYKEGEGENEKTKRISVRTRQKKKNITRICAEKTNTIVPALRGNLQKDNFFTVTFVVHVRSRSSHNTRLHIPTPVTITYLHGLASPQRSLL